jgi:hypothetical protein
MSILATVGAGDPSASRLVYALVAALGLLAITMFVLAVWLLRSTRPERELFAPLELMSRRSWRRSDPVWQRRQLDAVRPPGAEPLEAAPPVPTPDVDLRGVERAEPRGFDDLAVDVAIDAESPAESEVVEACDVAAVPEVVEVGEAVDVVDVVEVVEASAPSDEVAAVDAATAASSDAAEIEAPIVALAVAEQHEESAGGETELVDPDSTPPRLVDPLLDLFRHRPGE